MTSPLPPMITAGCSGVSCAMAPGYMARNLQLRLGVATLLPSGYQRGEGSASDEPQSAEAGASRRPEPTMTQPGLSPTEQFAALVQSTVAALPLDRAMLLIAVHARPDRSVDEGLHRID